MRWCSLAVILDRWPLVLAKVEANRNKRAAEPKAAVPLESSLESLVRVL